ncbi:hypothetical protein JW916_10570 [Candidatus Sumerlaeota bacterium]|nr:hypothetical protein [Candidatus Sumerlaeota bacterium]
MIKPLFTRERELERSLSQSADAGSRVLYTASASDFSVGDRLFVSESDGSELEYLGAIAEVAPTSLTATFPLETAKSATARVWRPASAFQWETVTASPSVDRVLREGIVAERSVGGALWSARVADPWREDTLRFPGLSRAHFTAFRSWLASATRGGLDDFTWVDETRCVARVRLLDSGFDQKETVSRVVDLVLKLAVLEEGGTA